MISVTVLGILAMGFAYAMKVETKLAQNANSETELIWLGRSGVERARYILAQQLALGCEPYDSLDQVWAGGAGGLCTSNSPLANISLKDYPLGDGKFSLTITDLERKYNINILPEYERQRAVEQALRLVGVDAGDISAITGAILDWIDPNDAVSPGGAESSYYQSLNPPYFAKNKPIDDLSELLLVRGVTPEIYWGGVASNHLQTALQDRLRRAGLMAGAVPYSVGLVDIFTPISSGRININTASATVLQMIPGVDSEIAEAIVAARSGEDDGSGLMGPYRTVEQVERVPEVPRSLIGVIRQFCDVRSRTFEVQVDAEVAGYKRRFLAILARNSPKDVQVLSFSWK
jgi:general secretion pathway protein K